MKQFIDMGCAGVENSRICSQRGAEKVGRTEAAPGRGISMEAKKDHFHFAFPCAIPSPGPSSHAFSSQYV